jgi:hypothetical protein
VDGVRLVSRSQSDSVHSLHKCTASTTATENRRATTAQRPRRVALGGFPTERDIVNDKQLLTDYYNWRVRLYGFVASARSDDDDQLLQTLETDIRQTLERIADARARIKPQQKSLFSLTTRA